MASMSNHEKNFAIAEAEKEIPNEDMTVDDTDADSGCGIGKESNTDLGPHECPPAWFRDLLTQIQELHLSVRTISQHVVELSSAINEVKTDVNAIKGSVKLIEIVICTHDDGKKINVPTPANADTMNVDVVTLPHELKNTPGGGSSSSQKRKSVLQRLENEYDNDFLDLTIENDEIVTTRTTQTCSNPKILDSMAVSKPQLPAAWTQPQLSICRSEFKRVGITEPNNGEAPILGPNQIVKKLFQSPSPTQASCRMRTIAQQQLGTPSARGIVKMEKHLSAACKGKAKIGEAAYTIPKIPGNMLPKGLKLKFRPTNDMGLDMLDLQVVAYVFYADQDPGEVLVNSRDMYASRADFDSLCPGKPINKTIITLATEKTRWVQKALSIQSVWSLPPSFAEDISLGRTFNEMMETYVKYWMEPYPSLKYIYVPLKANREHWYLMVISMPDETVYHLDSFLNVQELEPRRKQIATVCEVLYQMIESSYYGNTFLGRRMDFPRWDIKDARGIPNCGRSDNSSVWLLSWLDMEQYFTPNLIGTLAENNVRMTAATSLLLGLYNEMRSYLEDRAIMFWEMLSQ